MIIKKEQIKFMNNIDEMVNNSLNGTAFAYRYFLDLKKVSYCLCVYDNNKIVAFMPLFEEGNFLNQSTMYIPYGGPLLLYSKNKYRKYFLYTREVISTIMEYIKTNYDESSFSFDPSLTDIIPCVKNNFVPEVRYTYIINLKQSLEEIYNNFGKDRKKDIKLTNEVEIFIDDKLAEFDLEKALSWEHNYGIKTSVSEVKVYLQESIKNNCGKCFIAKRENDILGGVAVVWDKKRCYIMYSYYEKSSRTVIPKIYYTIIKYLKDNSICEILDFEGSVFPEIENFNLSFGAKQELYFNYYYEKDKNKLYSELYDYGEKNG